LIKAHKKLSNDDIELADVLQQENDPVSADMLIGRAKLHDKDIWMINSLLN
jgi:DNA-binding ferritin-like protein